MTRFLIVALSLFIALITQAQNSQNESVKGYLLQYKPKVGTKGVLNMRMDMKMEMKVMGQTMPVTQLMVMDCNMRIINQSKKTTTTQMDYNYITMDFENAMVGAMNYDSREVDPNDPYAANLHTGMRGLLDSNITMVQDRTGRVVNEGTEQQGMSMTPASQVGTNNINSLMGLSHFPEESIQIGDTWTNTTKDPNSPMALKMTYTLESVNKGIAMVKVDGIISLNEDFEGEQSITKIAGTQSGSFTYNIEDMWMLEGSLNQKFNMTILQNGMEMPTNVNSNIELKVK